jgi:hypothetical protein
MTLLKKSESFAVRWVSALGAAIASILRRVGIKSAEDQIVALKF